MFIKLFSSITTSSIWAEDDATRIVWITLLAMSDRTGYVAASVGGLAHEARVDRERCEAAIKKLSEPDSDSRSKEFDGRRIEVVAGGFQLLNYAKYREIKSEEERREYMRAYMRDYRIKRKQSVKNVSNVRQSKPKLAHAEAEAEGEGEQKKNSAERVPDGTKTFISEWAKAWEEMFKERYVISWGKDGAAAKKLLEAQPDQAKLLTIARIAWQQPNCFWCKQAISLQGFAGRFNEIRAAARAIVAQNANDSTNGSVPRANGQSKPMTIWESQQAMEVCEKRVNAIKNDRENYHNVQKDSGPSYRVLKPEAQEEIKKLRARIVELQKTAAGVQ